MGITLKIFYYLIVITNIQQIIFLIELKAIEIINQFGCGTRIR